MQLESLFEKQWSNTFTAGCYCHSGMVENIAKLDSQI